MKLNALNQDNLALYHRFEPPIAHTETNKAVGFQWLCLFNLLLFLYE